MTDQHKGDDKQANDPLNNGNQQTESAVVLPGEFGPSSMQMSAQTTESHSLIASLFNAWKTWRSGGDPVVNRLIEQNRLNRVPTNCAISAIGWIFFGGFYVLRDTPYTAILCLTFGVIMMAVFSLIVRNPANRKFHANLHLGVTFAGLILESLTSGVFTSNTLPFFCCLGAMAAHQSGMKVAFAWTLLSALTVASFHFLLEPSHWPVFRTWNLLDAAIALGGMYFLLTAMAAQAEWLATKYFVMLHNNAKKLSHIAQHDQLTQLANRYQFREQLRRASEAYRNSGQSVGLLMLDLDSFKDVNDSLGHLAGDEVLQEVASRLKRIVPNEHTVARIGGDEFTLIVHSTSIEELDKLAREIVVSICKPYWVTERECNIGASIGAALIPAHTRCVDELQAFADLAVYASKATGQQITFYDPKMSEELFRKRVLVERLAQAVNENEFSLVYQPQVETSSGRITGVEALLRWESNQTDVPSVSPSEFVPILESTGQIQQAGRWVLEHACVQARDWLDMGIDCCVSVNVSPIQFQSPDFVQNVLDVLQATKIPPRCLDLEVTEGVMVDRLDETRAKLQRLKNAGVVVSVDDFGTGYSSLSYLKHLAIDRLKIDRAFVKDIPNFDDGSIASAIVSLAHSLDLQVVAEGVETEEQLQFLRDLDCESYQGYLFSRPLSADDCTELLLADARPTADLGEVASSI